MAGRLPSGHAPTEVLAQGNSIPYQSVNAGTVNGTGVDLAGKRGVYFLSEQWAATGAATATFFLQDSPDNSTFTNVNTTTYPEATVAATNTANSVRELAYAAGAGRQRYVRIVVTTAANAFTVSAGHVTY